MRSIVLGGRTGVTGYAIVDDPDYMWLTERKWCKSNGGYAKRVERIDGKDTTILMHRQILGLNPGDSRQGDHINRNRLDNRRVNLRVVSAAEQRQNTFGKRGTLSRYRGVTWHNVQNRWVAKAMLAGKIHVLGYFKDEHEAGRVASEWRAKNMPFSVEDIREPTDSSPGPFYTRHEARYPAPSTSG